MSRQILPFFLMLLLHDSAGSKKTFNNALIQKCAPYLPGELQKSASAWNAYCSCKPVPSHKPTQDEIFDLLSEIPEMSMLVIMLRLFTYQNRNDSYDSSSPAGMAELIQTILPPSMKEKIPDIETLMGMMSMLQSMDLSDNEESDDTFSPEQTDFLRSHIK